MKVLLLSIVAPAISHCSNEAIGIIAGNGIYPAIFAQGARSEGVNSLVAAAFEGETDPSIEEIADEVSWMRVGQLSKMIKFFEQHKITKAVMVGQIAPKNLFDLRPDMRTLMLLGRLKERNAESIFNGIGEELAKSGIELIPATTFLDDLLPDLGHVCGPKPAKRVIEDAAFGFKIAVEGQSAGTVAVGSSLPNSTLPGQADAGTTPLFPATQ